MKSKTFSKKLILNKNTIADLNNKEMTSVIGGLSEPPLHCVTETCPSDCFTEDGRACLCLLKTRDCPGSEIRTGCC